ncbi:MAG: Hsp70 family protein, partial [Phormidesmis sp. CAN_BIN44]|nr:Hsp70 family protein [Phormidesmis sp. CAN_BIN44]
GLSGSEIERMKQEAEVFAEEDTRRKHRVELRNKADGLFASYESTMRDNGEFINDSLKDQANEKVDELKNAIANPKISIEDLTQKVDALQQILFAIGAAVYGGLNQDREDSGEPSSNGASKKPSPNSDFDFDNDATMPANFENDATIAADYEAVD